MVLRKLHAKVHMQLLLKLQVHLNDFNCWGILKDPHRDDGSTESTDTIYPTSSATN
jgi:hypothetical protein